MCSSDLDAVEAWCEFLELQGYRVRVFCDAVEAAQFVTNHPDQFDLIITDLTMPGISGIEILERLRQVSPAKPAVLTTGYSNADVQARLGKLSGVAILQKPFRLSALAEVVTKQLQDGSPSEMIARV